MARLRSVRARELRAILLRKGFTERPTKSGHRFYLHSDGRRTVVPFHSKPIAKGVLHSILKQAGLTIKDLE